MLEVMEVRKQKYVTGNICLITKIKIKFIMVIVLGLLECVMNIVSFDVRQ
jgi:hypothetical protein